MYKRTPRQKFTDPSHFNFKINLLYENGNGFSHVFSIAFLVNIKLLRPI